MNRTKFVTFVSSYRRRRDLVVSTAFSMLLLQSGVDAAGAAVRRHCHLFPFLHDLCTPTPKSPNKERKEKKQETN
jgi:hypothetical protein